MANFNADDAANDVIKRLEKAKGDRGTWEGHWEEVARRVLPNYVGSFTGRGSRTQGDKRTEDMVDATAALALPKFAAAMESMLTPRNQTWHRLRPKDPILMRNRSARAWYDAVNDALFSHRYAPRANFANQQHEVYTGLGAFGTGGMFIDKLQHWGERGLRYQSIHLGEIYFLENHQGIIDTALREFELTARQALQKFPEGLPEEVMLAAKDSNKCENKFWFVHCVAPRTVEEGYDPGRLDYKGMRFTDKYVSVTGKRIVREGGYNTFPYPISRYTQAPGELYGRSPAMLALPAIKVLNEEKKTIIKQGHRIVDPVLLAHDDGVLDSVDLTPGTTNYGGVSPDGKLLVHALPTGNLSLAKEMMQMEASIINDAFMVTLFQILVETPQMTATEVVERAREKGVLLSPSMGRQQSEYLGPLVERELDVLAQQGLLPPMPPIVKQARAEYDLIYDSPLSRAQRAEQAAGLMRTVGWATEIATATQDPRPLDHFDWDTIIPELSDIQAVPARWMASPEMVAATRDGRSQAAQQQQGIDALPAVAGAMKAMPSAG